MDKLNFKDNLDKGLSAEEIIKNFFAQACDDISNNILNSMVVKERSFLPLPNTNYDVYAVASQNEIDKLILFKDDGFYYEKQIKKMTNSLSCQIYNISISEFWGEIFGTMINCTIVKKSSVALFVRDIIIAEDELRFAQQAFYDNISGVMY